MIKTFKYTTDLEHTYLSAEPELGLKTGDIFKLIHSKLSYIEKTSDTHYVYHYEYLISIPEDGCIITLGDKEWSKLMFYSEYINSQ